MELSFLEKLLNYYGISLEEYEFLTRELTISDLPNPLSFNRMDEAISIVKDAMKKSEKIIVYGDYDADGVMSTSIVVKAFSLIKYDVNYYVPSRYLDGYGINLTKAKEIVEKGYKLLITVDNGVTAFEAIEYCKNHGMRIIVIDHHEYEKTLPEADVILHPQISNFGKIKTSAGFVSLMFATALIGHFDKYLMTLASISLITDMMPLKEYNRDLLRYVFSNYKFGEFKNLDLLSYGEKFDESTIGMKIGPKINAIGRLIKNTNINRLVSYFTTTDLSVINHLYAWIIEVNEQRKIKSKNAIDNLEDIDSKQDGLVVLVDCEEGLIGIIANKILNEYRKPVVVFTKDSANPEVLKGSCRSLEGFDIIKAFDGLSEFSITSGGHALAGGITINNKDLEKFTIKFNEIARKHPPLSIISKNIQIKLVDVSLSNYRLLESLSPFGEDWRAPLFMLKHIKCDALTFSRTGEHIMTSLSPSIKLVGFNISRASLKDIGFIDAIGKIETHSYNGNDYIQFKIEETTSAD